MIFSVTYELILLLLTFLTLPRYLYKIVIQGKYIKNIALRFGIGYPKISKKGKRLVWVHAVSLGETRAVSRLVKMIKKRGDVTVVISSATETGQAEAKKELSEADYFVYLPFDFRFVVRPIVRSIQPDLVIICETDFWYNFLDAAKSYGAKIVLVNGKVSLLSLYRHQKFPIFSRKLFSLFDLFCLQGNIYKERFLKMGIPEDKIYVTGNMKFDDKGAILQDEERISWKRQMGIKEDEKILVIGSTHYPEEQYLLPIIKEIVEEFPLLKILLVPRHPERFSEVANLLRQQQIPYVRLSMLKARSGNEKVILIDAMGLLKQTYQIADLAIVGGSYTQKIGGHNILEPSWYGVPVICGPYMHSQPELIELALGYHTALQIPLNQLKLTLLDWLQNPQKAKLIGHNGECLMKEMQGASARTLKKVEEIFKIT